MTYELANKSHLDQLLAASPLGVVVHDNHGHFVHANASFAQLLGYELSEVLTLSAHDIIHPEDRAARDLLAARIESGELDEAVADRRLIGRDGHVVWVRAYKSAISVGGERLVMVCIQDVREWVIRLDELGHAATHDQLTGLLNRAGLTKSMETVLAQGRSGRLAVLDLNGLKSVNDHFGHAAGDRVLRATADLLKASSSPSWLIGRIGGDEFVVVDWAATTELRPILATALSARVAVASGITTVLSASIGEAGFNAGSILDEVLYDADREMYRQKRARNMYGDRSSIPTQDRREIDWETTMPVSNRAVL